MLNFALFSLLNFRTRQAALKRVILNRHTESRFKIFSLEFSTEGLPVLITGQSIEVSK